MSSPKKKKKASLRSYITQGIGGIIAIAALIGFLLVAPVIALAAIIVHVCTLPFTRTWRKANACMRAAEAQVKAGNLAEACKHIAQAKEVAARICNDSRKAEACLRIAVTQVEVGDLAEARKSIDQAKEAATKIRKATVKAAIYKGIAKAHAIAGDAAKAKETALQISSDTSKAVAYLLIAKVQTEAKDVDGAKETVALISHDFIKMLAYVEIAEIQAKVGNMAGAHKTFAQAEEVATQIDKPIKGFPHGAMGAIVQSRVKAGDLAGAKETASRISDDDAKDWADEYIAQAEMKYSPYP